MSVQMSKGYMEKRAQLASGREDHGHADVVIKYSTYYSPESELTRLHPKLGCSAKDNISIEQCAECEDRQRSCCCFTRGCVISIVFLGSAGFCLPFLLPFLQGPKCRFKYITVSAARAMLTLTRGETEVGAPAEGATFYVFGRNATVVADKLGGTYVSL